MTNAEISKWLSNLKNDIGQSQYQPLWHYAEALNMAIEALRNEQKAEESFLTADEKSVSKGDVVYRQAAIDALSFDKEFISRVLDDIDVVGTDREKYSWGLGLLESNIEDINELPSAQPEQRWIPCSERLPEEEQKVLYSTRTGRVHSGVYHNDDSANQWYSHIDKCRAWNNVVIAWQPLPEPYQADMRGEET